MKIQLLFIFFLLSVLQTSSQLTTDTLQNTADSSIVIPEIFDSQLSDNIKSVRLQALNSQFAEPIVSILPGSKLILTFDDFSEEFKQYRYEILHCNTHWEITNNFINDYYLTSMNQLIETYSFSSATKAAFTHYELILPKEGEKFIRSGNFLIQVKDNESDSIVFIKRFMVVDPKINVNGKVVRTDDVRYSAYKQQIQFEVFDPKSYILDIGNIYVRIMKNASQDIYCEDIKPSFVNNNRITFERSDACIFDGGNEYRFFNMLEYKYLSNNVFKVDMSSGGIFDLFLEEDKSRSYLKYSLQSDFNGRIMYGSGSKVFPPEELDYARVYFAFKPEESLFGYEIYLYGELSQYRLNEDFKMIFNPERNRYELTKTLKQGLYNYQYFVKSIYQEGPDESLLEGSHFQTENEYCILVYYRNIREGYDQLLGIERLKSTEKKVE